VSLLRGGPADRRLAKKTAATTRFFPDWRRRRRRAMMAATRSRKMAMVINLERYFAKFSETFSPQVVGELNGQHVKLVRLEGDRVPWHAHDREDELFWVVDGVLEVHERAGVTLLHPGEFCIVRHGVEHKVVPRGHVKIVLFEPAGIAHTGNVKAEITKERLDRLIP
jgi:mannose-6-phosphate isomerase-like protein (cupin superfamily)